jgi:hypothetical protein
MGLVLSEIAAIRMCIYIENAEIVSINPLYPPILGDFGSWGAPPDPRQEISCTSFSVQSVKPGLNNFELAEQ